jgi:hypothetical protein
MADYKEIRLSNGMMTKVDPEDLVKLNQWGWNWHRGGNHARRSCRVNGKITTVNMHREIMNAPKGTFVDHINGDGLDNRKANLRICTPLGSARNRGLRKDSKTGFKGVCFSRGRYIASIGGKAFGYFKSAEAAARAYDKKANKVHGEYARYNFPDEWK